MDTARCAWRSTGKQKVKLCSVLPLQSDDKFQVILRREDVPLGRGMSPSQLRTYELPLMWQLYPGDRYRSNDSGFWKIVYHIKASTVPPGTEWVTSSSPGLAL